VFSGIKARFGAQGTKTGRSAQRREFQHLPEGEWQRKQSAPLFGACMGSFALAAAQPALLPHLCNLPIKTSTFRCASPKHTARSIVDNVESEISREEAPSQARARRVPVLMPNMRKAETRGELHFIAVKPSNKNQESSHCVDY
jgi:hypothetical protein